MAFRRIFQQFSRTFMNSGRPTPMSRFFSRSKPPEPPNLGTSSSSSSGGGGGARGQMWSQAKRSLQWSGMITAGFITYNTSWNPVTGKLNFVFPVPQSLLEVISEMSMRESIRLLSSTNPTGVVNVQDSPLLTKVVDQILKEIADERAHVIHWRPILLMSNIPNAVSIPNGVMIFSSEILRLCDNEAMLASVVAHEMSHILAKHGQNGLVWTAFKSLFFARGVLSQFADEAELYLLHIKREKEYEADYMGLLAMARAGYNPKNALEYLHRLNIASENFKRRNRVEEQPEAHLTHPPTEDRIRALLDAMPEAEKLYHKWLENNIKIHP